MTAKQILVIVLTSIVGTVVTGMVTAPVWLTGFLLFPPGSSSGGFVPITFSSKENLVILTVLMTLLGLVIGLVIGCAVGLINLFVNKNIKALSALAGSIISFSIPMFFVLAMAADDASRGAGGGNGAIWTAIALFVPQCLIGAASGLSTLAISNGITKAFNR